MNVLLVGLGSAQAAQVGELLRQHWHGVHGVHLSHKPHLGEPVQDVEAMLCKLCVVDLPGLGWLRHSAVHESSLLLTLAQRSALLLVRGADRDGWPLTGMPLAPGQRLHWLAAPHTPERLQSALAALCADVAVPSGALPLPIGTPAPLAGRPEPAPVPRHPAPASSMLWLDIELPPTPSHG